MGRDDQRSDASTEDLPEKKTWKGLLLDMYVEILEENVLLKEQIITKTSSQDRYYSLFSANVSKKKQKTEQQKKVIFCYFECRIPSWSHILA